jgi:hypothetical protein
VTLSQAAPSGGTAVTLSSSDTSIARCPASVTMVHRLLLPQASQQQAQRPVK